MASNDDSCPMTQGGNAWASEINDISVEFGTVYYIEWDDRWSGSGFDFTIELTEECLDYCYADVTNMGFSILKSDELIAVSGEVNSTITAMSKSTIMANSLDVMSGGTIMIEDEDCDVNSNLDWMAIAGSNKTIADNATTTIDFEIGSGANATLSELAIRLDIEHEDVSQLIITVQSPEGKSIKLWNQYCAAEKSINFYVSETGTIAPLCSDLYSSGGRYYSPGQIPENSFNNFYNVTSIGTCQIIIEDTLPGGIGNINEIFLYMR